jgi:predicted RNase H-like HicB family nuclease
MFYAAHYSKEGNRTLISFPDCPGCQTFSEGNNPIEIAMTAQEALAGWLEAHLIAGHIPPRPKQQTYVKVFVPFELAVAVRECWARHADDP